MTCHEFEAVVVDVARSALAPREQQDAQMHARDCAPCNARLNEQHTLTRALRRVVEDAQDRDPSPFVEQRLVAAFRAQAPHRARWSWSPAWMGAAATIAVVMITSALWMADRHRNQQDSTGTTSSTSSATAFSDSEAVPIATEALADFVPLPYGSGTANLESAHVVRLDIPRSTLVRMGVTVPADRWSEQVPADVLFGEDGLARAIRFRNEN